VPDWDVSARGLRRVGVAESCSSDVPTASTSHMCAGQCTHTRAWSPLFELEKDLLKNEVLKLVDARCYQEKKMNLLCFSSKCYLPQDF